MFKNHLIKIFLLFISSCFVWLTSYADTATTQSTTPQTPQQQEVQSFVTQAVNYIKAHGKKAAFAEFSNQKGSFVNGTLFIFAYDFNGTGLANGVHTNFIGQDKYSMQDKSGKYIIRDLITLAKNGGGWDSYYWPNPLTHKIECKTSYVVPVNNSYLVGSGSYSTSDAACRNNKS